MLAPVFRENSRYYAYTNNMLNVVYLTGWVRNPDANGFLLQQTNNIQHAIPVSLGNKSKIKKVAEFQKIKIIAHLVGERDSNGTRSIRLDPIHSESPTMLEMPMEDLFFTRSARAGEDDFMPFDKKFKEKLAKDQMVIDNFKNEVLYQEIVNSGVRAEYSLSLNCNQAQVAGYLSGFALRKGDGYEKDCLLLAIRQHRDDNLSIPVRLYGSRVLTYAKMLRTGMRIQVSGSLARQYKEVEVPGSTEKRIDNYVYIKASDVSSPDMEKGIKREPDWIIDMLNDMRKEMEAKKQATAEAQAKKAAATAEADDSVTMAMD
jgi:hypothetical protein